MIPESDPDLTIYLKKLFQTNKQERQNDTFSFPTPENSGKLEDHTSRQTRFLKNFYELKEKEKLNPKDDTETRMKILKRFHWTNILLTESEKTALEDILDECHDIFARHQMDIKMNTDFKVKLTPKDDKTVCSQNLPVRIYLTGNLFVELALVHNYGIITVLPFPNT